jgi:hypothetical protein
MYGKSPKVRHDKASSKNPYPLIQQQHLEKQVSTIDPDEIVKIIKEDC